METKRLDEDCSALSQEMPPRAGRLEHLGILCPLDELLKALT